MKQEYKKLRGTRDFYPIDMQKRKWLLNILTKTVKNYGYEEYDAPILEFLNLYTAKTSVEIVEKQAYVFKDRAGRDIVVRPEMTPTLARMVAAKQNELPKILRWYSLAECWRYENPQKGRLRSFLQLNVDLMGSDSVYADSEIIDIALNILERVGVDLNNIKVKINDRNLLNALLSSLKVLENKKSIILSIIDKKDKMTSKEWRNLLANQNLTSRDISSVEEFVVMKKDNIPDKKEYFQIKSVINNLRKLGWEKQIEFDPGIVRGFDYYTGLVFEVFETSGKFNRSIFGGGRYDKLIESYGGNPMSAIGFAISLIVLEVILLSQGKKIQRLKEKKCMVVPYSEKEMTIVQDLLKKMRLENINSIAGFPEYDLTKNLKLSNNQDVDITILITPDEFKENKVVLKYMKKKTQEKVDVSEVVNKVKQKFN